jgi:peroxiredoxin
MNLIKSIYLIIYITTVLVGTSAFAIYQFWLNGYDLHWLGVILAASPFGLRLGIMMILDHEARTSRHLPVIMTLALIGLVLSLGDSQTTILAIYSFASLLVYIFWYSKLNRPSNEALDNGNPLPSFAVEDPQGSVVDSQSFIGQPNLILFYRGNWCPLCVAQIKEVAAQYQQLHDAGIKISLISPQPHENTEKLAAKFSVPMQFLVDKNNQAAKKLNILMENGLPTGLQVLGYDSDTVFPTVIITDKEGLIIYNDQTDNYRVRPEPDTFIHIFKQQGLIN